MTRKLEEGEIAVCRSFNRIIVADGSGRKQVITDPTMMEKSDEEIKQQFKCFNVKNKGVK